jgi:branched-chain amino acid transport system ATP-binding protein
VSSESVKALEIRNLSVSYGGVRALRDLSLVVPKGAVVALLGPNGAGKSTTLRAISGIIRADHGTIEVDGRRVDRMPAYRIARMGVVHVPEGRGIFPSLTVRENLEMAVASLAHIDDPIAEGAALFPVLGSRLRQLAGSLSGGEQQMLALARALMAQPKLLMVDEISMGLAPIIVGQLFEALRKLAATGTSLLLVEQYVETALELADYVYVMEKGAVADVGEPTDLRASGLATAYLGGVA